MAHVTVAQALSGGSPAGTEVTVRGWVRSRRDTRAQGGLSFVSVHDGSCFDPIQVVAEATLPNYEQEISRLTTGCSVIATGRLVESQGKGQSLEIQATAIEVIGWVDDPETYPVAAKRRRLRVPPRGRPPAAPHQHLRGGGAGAPHLSMAVHRYLDERGFHWVHTPIITASDAEGAGEMFRVSTLDLTNLAAVPRTPARSTSRHDFFGEDHLTVSGQLEAEDLRMALATSTPSAPPSVPRTPTPPATSPSSG